MDEKERIRLEARAAAFDDAAAIMCRSGESGQKLETSEDWLAASYTFSNQAYFIREQLAGRRS